ncbi:unnamed protein product [Phytophthora fragariaefolia]|uniref:Unnamed protein product n=1 Tax=Phytophthora fragariaefolia TaxID=1490495 RepID=A0A9W6UEC3_9STRA|nr:unnamed protein product [Phytophthora fragariaefolia]
MAVVVAGIKALAHGHAQLCVATPLNAKRKPRYKVGQPKPITFPPLADAADAAMDDQSQGSSHIPDTVMDMSVDIGTGTPTFIMAEAADVGSELSSDSDSDVELEPDSDEELNGDSEAAGAPGSECATVAESMAVSEGAHQHAEHDAGEIRHLYPHQPPAGWIDVSTSDLVVNPILGILPYYFMDF